MSKVVVDVSMSLNGFIARPNDEIDPLHDWLFDGDKPSRHSDSFKFEDDPLADRDPRHDPQADRLSCAGEG